MDFHIKRMGISLPRFFSKFSINKVNAILFISGVSLIKDRVRFGSVREVGGVHVILFLRNPQYEEINKDICKI